MAYRVTTVAFGSTGVQSIPTDFVATGYKIILGKKVGTTQNFSAMSFGWCDGTNQWYQSFFQSDTAGKKFQGTDRVVHHHESTGATVVEASHSAITGGGSPSIDVNISVTNANYDWVVEYWD